MSKTKFLNKIYFPTDLKQLNHSELKILKDELREEMINAVSETGGHLGAGLGVVELTLALHYVFDTPKDKIILTFDDGLIDHYKFVYPILKEMKLWGVFYIPTAQFTDKKILPVHLIHLLCGSIQPKKLINQLIGYTSSGQAPTLPYISALDSSHLRLFFFCVLGFKNKLLCFFINF